MIDELQLFKGQNFVINKHIKIHHPTLNEICEYGEQRYYNMVSNLCSTPSDYKVPLLDNFGINYDKINELEFFYLIIQGMDLQDTNILFGDLNFNHFKLEKKPQNQEVVLSSEFDGIIIDFTIYSLIVSHIRKIHNFEKSVSIAGNEHTRQYLLDKERRQLQRQKNKKYHSILTPLISSMVNCEQFKYDHSTVWTLPIYVFMDSVLRIQKLKNYDQLMQGVYTGNIDFKTLSKESLSWMGGLSES